MKAFPVVEPEEESVPLEVKEGDADDQGADSINHDLADDSATTDLHFHLGGENLVMK